MNQEMAYRPAKTLTALLASTGIFPERIESMSSPGVLARGQLRGFLLCSFVFHTGYHLTPLKTTLSTVQRRIDMIFLESRMESKPSLNKIYHF